MSTDEVCILAPSTAHNPAALSVPPVPPRSEEAGLWEVGTVDDRSNRFRIVHGPDHPRLRHDCRTEATAEDIPHPRCPAAEHKSLGSA
jgi:hypothetical protein